jgi:adenosine deaminase
VACQALGYDAAKVRQLCLNGVEASWLDGVDKAVMRQELNAEIDALQASLPG